MDDKEMKFLLERLFLKSIPKSLIPEDLYKLLNISLMLQL